MKKRSGKILIIDDREDILIAARIFLKQHFTLVGTETNPNLIPSLLHNENFDVILLDMNFTRDMTSGSEGFFWLDKILEIDPSAVVILITAFGDINTAVKAIKEGATDFILIPWENEKFLATISSAMNLRQSRNEVTKLKSRQRQLSADIDKAYHHMIGVSDSMKNVFNIIDKVAGTDANVFILGENGTGKELVARALHRQSLRSDECFMAIDMGAITDTLFESELFGYMKGAFTDAKENHPGRFEVATGGTLFLDEIANLSMDMQSKLLRVLETRKVMRLGASKPTDIDIRLICATNIDIHEVIKNGQFRQDLLYRINTVEIILPPLRDRKEDIPLLVDHFVKKSSVKYKKNIKRVSTLAHKKLEKYQWPGNIRELQHSMERAVILTENDVLQPSDFILTDSAMESNGFVFDTYDLEYVEKTIIRKLMHENDGNVTHVAKQLGITRTSLYRRLEKHGI
jgi:DNA-binding NtrC family response regulator